MKTFAKESGNTIFPVNVDDFNFRITYSTESKLEKKSGLVKGLLREWPDSKKVFRLLKRFSFYHPDMPFSVDLSVVKSSATNRQNRPIPSYKFKDSGLTKSNEIYEIEIEVDNSKIIAMVSVRLFFCKKQLLLHEEQPHIQLFPESKCLNIIGSFLSPY